ncbi:PP2C family protein-serine/threonine phosphatase [Leptospira bandrabouensis]|uniref:Serine/threonine-protein phosphatase n=1 Tax=Leptospira bandrabouensis TaxID=2484903 RepID=A0A6H3NT21_9LEPT|nr:PP2C family protein-serine/threonine phosphatase [Leptospira bandrabouensis]MCG6152998.1 serine/threonine-protein phosphatase [Leptospira bandrabouensis]TGN03800.1 serine/threonine-protein phosphatase [Leptospira bandrabouensis]TGN12174.1 serine/threonine-protein phosphatase [Leptospira bandrabouensis]
MAMIFDRIFKFIYKYISYSFAIVFFSLLGAFFGAFYAYFFGSALIPDFTTENHPQVVWVFLITTGIAAIGHSVEFGILSPLGFFGFRSDTKKLNTILKPNETIRHKDILVLESLLNTIINFPKENMYAAFRYALFIFISVSITHFIYKHPLYELALIFVGWLTAAFVYGGFSYIISDYFTGAKRVEIKKILSFRDVTIHKNYGIMSLKGKFIFLLILILLSLSVLAVFISFGNASLIKISAFITMTFFEAVILIFMFFQSINLTLEQINESANSLASGGSGSLPILSIDKEFIQFAENFEKATREVGRIRENLQELVEAKTSELRNSLETVEFLKKQQDGDYFLTSLLIKPLSLNKTLGTNVKTDFFIKQKKTFTFHGRENEIGGDICITRTVSLRGKDYTFFLNADAMGKSLQGAGGVLVLGAAVQSILERSLAVESVKQLYAERWIKNSFQELHHIFESFDCSMLVSMVMGLIDDETGLVYYINAEHPWSVLYRNEKSEFIKTNSELRKLGTPFKENALEISTLQLIPGDILILGSDGRDDIEFVSQAEYRKINHDEELFLHHVENGKGDLEKIYKSILDMGELTDDLSLMRISFKEHISLPPRSIRKESYELMRKARSSIKENHFENAKDYLIEANKINPENQEILRALIRLLVRIKDYKLASEKFNTYIEEFPGDTDLIYLASFTYKQTKEYGKAIDMGERIRLRNPGHLANLLRLVQLYLLVGNVSKAEKTLNLASLLAADSKRLVSLKSEIETLRKKVIH